ncbi:unnamed protein product [Rotaria sordida]|uniref:Uncharacterized protein n=1 Tax=Rotaria sordida TaxID=392033 RepID=A0A814H2P3_9BILA|nr:unnamed protein product [Rotaria sordida]
MPASNSGNQQSRMETGNIHTGLEPEHGDTKQMSANQNAQQGITSGAVSVDHSKSGGSSGAMGVGGSGSESHQPHTSNKAQTIKKDI